ncbi:MAG: hypothetical protein KC657_30135 [Myxococcales bacterium]|nr:hypothetical protein [Myxococcales bacterium]
MRAKRTPVLDRACRACGFSDSRGLTHAKLQSGETVTLCGTHELMLRRAGGAVDAGELRGVLSDRRDTVRRSVGGGDELAESLQEAFAPNRRRTERRAS